MGTVQGSQLLIKALTAHGVRQVFSLCGDHINAAYDASLDYGVRIVDVRHESAAARARI